MVPTTTCRWVRFKKWEAIRADRSPWRRAALLLLSLFPILVEPRLEGGMLLACVAMVLASPVNKNRFDPSSNRFGLGLWSGFEGLLWRWGRWQCGLSPGRKVRISHRHQQISSVICPSPPSPKDIPSESISQKMSSSSSRRSTRKRASTARFAPGEADGVEPNAVFFFSRFRPA